MLRLCLVRMTDGSRQQGCVRRRSVSPEPLELSSMVVIAGANGRPGGYGAAAHRRSEGCRQLSTAPSLTTSTKVGMSLTEVGIPAVRELKDVMDPHCVVVRIVVNGEVNTRTLVGILRNFSV